MISVDPLVSLDTRAYTTPTRLTLAVDPRRTSQFVLALSAKKIAEMWPDHSAWFTFARLRDEPAYLLSLHVSPYHEWTRKVPAAWMDAHWDGRLEYDIADSRACMRIPGGPAVCGGIPVRAGYALYATILAHAPEANAATRLALKEITRGLATPPGMSAEKRWFYVGDEDFDPNQFLKELGGQLQ